MRGGGVLLTVDLVLKPTLSLDPLLDPSLFKASTVASLIVALRSLYSPAFCRAPLILSVVNERAIWSTAF